MKKTLIDLQYEPGSIQDTIIVETAEGMEANLPIEETAAAPIEVPEAPEPEGEMVDFYLTNASIESLKGILSWSKILIVCFTLFTLLEGLMLLGNAQKMDAAPESVVNLLAFFRSLASIGIGAWLVWQMFQFNRYMGNAMKSNNNHTFLLATAHQATFFQWLFISILVNLGFGVLMIFSAW